MKDENTKKIDPFLQLQEQRQKYEKIVNILLKDNENLKDEVESLWMMMDEMTKTDIENWSKITSDLKLDVVSRALMVTKKRRMREKFFKKMEDI